MSKKASFSSFEEWYSRAAPELNTTPDSVTGDVKKLSQKSEDIFAREVLSIDPELATVITAVMQRLVVNGQQLPFIHITPHALLDKEGNVVGNTGNVDGIVHSGLRKMHTNVAGFVIPGNTHVGNPENFIDDPTLFIKDCVTIVKHYHIMVHDSTTQRIITCTIELSRVCQRQL